MADFSLDLNEDQLQIQKWVHDFAENVIRPAAPRVGRAGGDPVADHRGGRQDRPLLAATSSPTRSATRPASRCRSSCEELCWGDAGIALAIFGTTLGVSGIVGNGTPEQIAEWVPQCFGTPDDDPARPRSACQRARRRLRRVVAAHRAPSTTRPRTSGCSTAPRRGSPTAASPTCHVRRRRRSIPSSKGRGQAQLRRARRARPGLSHGPEVQEDGIRASHTAEVVLDDVRVPGQLPARRQGEARRPARPGPRGQASRGAGRR